MIAALVLTAPSLFVASLVAYAIALNRTEREAIRRERVERRIRKVITS